jgi:hypothetical protein
MQFFNKMNTILLYCFENKKCSKTTTSCSIISRILKRFIITFVPQMFSFINVYYGKNAAFL